MDDSWTGPHGHEAVAIRCLGSLHSSSLHLYDMVALTLNLTLFMSECDVQSRTDDNYQEH